jgi:hypothetical protein
MQFAGLWRGRQWRRRRVGTWRPSAAGGDARSIPRIRIPGEHTRDQQLVAADLIAAGMKREGSQLLE